MLFRSYIGQGGTIPLMNMLSAGFPKAQMMVCGVLGPKSNAHGPNEFLHIGYGTRLTAAVAEVIADVPEIAFAVSRVQYLARLPYCEIRGGLIDRDFLPAHLIRFFLSVLGMECTNPLSIRYVRGVFFTGMPLPAELARGTSEDWTFPHLPQLAAAE